MGRRASKASAETRASMETSEDGNPLKLQASTHCVSQRFYMLLMSLCLMFLSFSMVFMCFSLFFHVLFHCCFMCFFTDFRPMSYAVRLPCKLG